jgi:serine/threonine protein kinase
MKRIAVDPTACVASGLSHKPWANQCRTIDMADQPIARGGQGEIYPAARIDGHHVSDVLVKTFHQGFPPSLQGIVTALRDNNPSYGIEKCTALRALPLLLFTGTLHGQPVQGYVMRRVTGKPLNQILDDGHDLNAYINLPWGERIELCRQFVEGMHILYSLRIVHADLNGQNLMIDMAQGTLAIIDLDGGTVAGTGLTPVTIGKLEPGWLAPEIMAALVRTTARQQIPVGIAVDLWATACGVHHLLFGLPPFFFMAQQAQVPDYLARYTWPSPHGLQGIATHNASAFGYYERAYQQSPARRLLEFSFQRGYLDPGQRPTAYQWLQEFGAVLAQTGSVPRPRPVIPSPAPRPHASAPSPVPRLRLVTCPVCGEENDLDEVYCRYCAAQLCGDRWCPHSLHKRFVLSLPLLARFGRHQTPEKARYCVVCGGTL